MREEIGWTCDNHVAVWKWRSRPSSAFICRTSGGCQMPNDIIIRKVEYSDVDSLQSNCYAMNSFEQVEELVNYSLAQSLAGTGAQFVAVADGEVVGTVNVEVQQHGLRMHRAVVTGLIVNQEYTRRGIARMLIQACREEAARLNCTILEISCRAGEPPEVIYPRLGFIEYGRLPKGLKETWGDKREFDEVLFYMPIDKP
jgi:acetyltransferase